MRKLLGFLGHLALLGMLGSGLAFGAETSEGVAALEKIAARFPTLDAFLKDKNARKEYEEALVRYYGRTQFPCDSFNEVIDQVRRWVEADGSVAEKLWGKQKEWSYDFTWKTGKAPASDYRFVSVARRFHAIWLDLSKAGCFEGPCAPLTWSAPGRWAAALDGSALFHVEKGERYSGSSLLVVSALQSDRRLRLVAPTSPGLLTDRGFADGQKKSRTLVEQWAVAAKGKTPLVYVDGKDTVHQIGKKNGFGSSLTLKFTDALATNLMKVAPPKCTKEEPTQTAANFKVGSEAGASAPNSTSGGTGSASVPNQALGALLIALGTPAATPENPAIPMKPEAQAGLEKSLANELSKSPDPKKRAMAAMALDLLDEVGTGPQKQGKAYQFNSPTPRYPKSYSKPTRTALNQALRDPSPSVRAHSALAIASAGGTNALGGSPPATPELKSIRPPLAAALKETYQNPQAAVIDVPPEAASFASPSAIQEKAFDGRLQERQFLTPEERKRVFDAGENGPLDQRQAEIDRAIRNYTIRPKVKDALDALPDLKGDLKGRDADFVRSVLTGVEKKLVSNCKECNVSLLGSAK